MRRYSIRVLTLTLLIVILPSRTTGAAPSVTAVTGPFAAGATVSISGTGFGEKNPARPYLWADFERGAEASAETISLGALVTGNGELAYVAQDPGGWRWRGAPGILSGPDIGTNVSLSVDVSSHYAKGVDRVYIFLRRAYGDPQWWSAAMSEYRLLRLWAGRCSRYTPTDFTVTLRSGHLTFSNEGTTPPTPTPTRFPRAGQWIREEYQAFHGSVGRRDASINAWWDGEMVLDAKFTGRSAQFPDLWGCVRIENLETGARLTGRDQYVYMDDLYVDTTFARVMICSMPKWAACTDREPQLPLAWSDREITVQVNRGALADLGAAFLYVVNAKGEVNYAGFPLGAVQARGAGSAAVEPRQAVPTTPAPPNRLTGPPQSSERVGRPSLPTSGKPDQGQDHAPDPSEVIDWLLKRR